LGRRVEDLKEVSVAYRYVVIGTGRQGVAAAYDLARHGEAERITLLDRDVAIARAGAERLNKLLGRRVAGATAGDASQPRTLAPFLAEADGLLSAASYRVNLGLARLAVETKTHMVDLGGHTGIVRDELALNRDAKRAGIALVPDCGMGPGMNVTLALAAMDLLDEAEEVRIYDGGLPEEPKPPWNYTLLFSAEGLVNEYEGEAYFLRRGEVTPVPALSELEELEISPLGKLEAFVTSGGLSTMPWTFEGKLRVLENKTLRYPGHCRLLQSLRALGLFGREPIPVGNATLVPRELLIALFDRSLSNPEAHDVCVMHVRARGMKGGRPAEARANLLDRYDPTTGFRAMERLTGWHAALVLALAVNGEIAPGATPIERALSGERFLAAAPQRGWHVATSVVPTR
jgi:lysine 6-dehydrogenase